MKKKIIITRHCTTSWNRAQPKRVQGHTDIPLDKDGFIEAELLAETLRPLGIQKIISSDLMRASQTADIIAKKLQISAIQDPRIRECACGTLEGMTRDEVLKQYGESIIKHWDDEYQAYDFSPFGGENRTHVTTRHIELFHDLHHLCPEERILLVGHGRGLNTLLAELGHPPGLKRGEIRILEYEYLT